MSMRFFEKKLKSIRLSLLEEPKRIRMQFALMYWVLAAVSLFMTLVNVFTQKHMLMLSTLIFGLLCCINVILSKQGEKGLRVSEGLFSVELLVLLSFFLVSGTPEGFSAIWICMLPACGLLLFRRKWGSILCGIMYLILVFFLDTPLGSSFLRYPYTDSFKLRFPMLFVAFFAASFLLESIRAFTFDEMKKTREKYEYLYRHDALTEVYNRYGFNERMEALLRAPGNRAAALLILDLDNFKRVNDLYGHSFGDQVLKQTTEALVRVAGSEADVCRWGGEEFAVLLSGDADVAQCGANILEAIRSLPITVGENRVPVTASIGAAYAPHRAGLEPEDFVRAADACLYNAKEQGRNRGVYRQLQPWPTAKEPVHTAG